LLVGAISRKFLAALQEGSSPQRQNGQFQILPNATPQWFMHVDFRIIPNSIFICLQ